MNKYTQKINEERKNQNMTVKELCFEAKITETTYFNFLKGKMIGYKTFLKFFEILKIDL